MDSIEFRVVRNDFLVIDGIDFSRSITIRPIINSKDIISENFNQDALMVFAEWEKRAQTPGKYLLFTSLIGIADDGGWELCKTQHQGGMVSIEILYEDDVIAYQFEKRSLLLSVNKVAAEISSFLSKNPTFRLEPCYVVFPE